MSTRRFAFVIAAIVLVCYGVDYRCSPPGELTIEIASADVERIVSDQERLFGRQLTDDERRVARNDFIEQEILVREAYRRGLDRIDPRVRSMLIDRAYREMLRATEYEPSPPTERELQSYFEEHADRYVVPERLVFERVSFPLGTTPETIDQMRSVLQSEADPRSSRAANFDEVNLSDLATAFGLERAREIASHAQGEWHGPYASSTGWHLLLLTKRLPSQRRELDAVRSEVEQDFLRDQAERAVDAELARSARHYRVEIDGVD